MSDMELWGERRARDSRRGRDDATGVPGSGRVC